MGNNIRITEDQYNRLFTNNEDLFNGVLSPLREILKCRITEDRKHVTYLGRVYDGVTGEELPLTEQALGLTKALGTTGKVGASDDGWSLSDIIHTGVDLVSMGADFIVPGSGAIIDIVHSLSYIVEAQFSSGEEKDTLYLMAAITGMFAILPGALQAVAPILKRFVKTGGKVAMKKLPLLKTAWDFISKNLSSFLSKLPGWVDKAVNSPIGKKILGGNVDNISKGIADFSTRIKSILNTLKSKTAGLQSSTKKIINKQIDKMSPKVFSKNNQIINVNGGVTNLLTKNGKANSAALSSINRTGGFAKYKDVIVYDLKTGIAYGRNSKEGIKAIANNTKLLSTKGGAKQISKDIPSDWLKYTKDKVRGVKSVGTSATKNVSNITTKTSVKKMNGLFRMLSGYGNLPRIIRMVPLGPMPIIGFVRTISKSGNIFGKKGAALLYYSFGVTYLSYVIHELLCEMGIKNTSHLKKEIEKSKSEGIEFNYDTPATSLGISLISKVWDLFGTPFFERLFLVQDCNKTLSDTLNKFDIDIKEVAKEVGGEAGERIKKIKDKVLIDYSDIEAITVID